MKLSILIPVYNQERLIITALDSIPRRDDIEVLVRNDGSTDNTLKNLLAYQQKCPELNLTVYTDATNHGVAWTKNRLFESACGEYVHFHDSDDHVDTELYSGLIDGLCGEDVYVMNLIVNTGNVYEINAENHMHYCAQIARLIRREFAEGLTFPEDVRAGDDGVYAVALENRHPSTVYTGVPAYYYNYPREGSLTDMRLKGILP